MNRLPFAAGSLPDTENRSLVHGLANNLMRCAEQTGKAGCAKLEINGRRFVAARF